MRKQFLLMVALVAVLMSCGRKSTSDTEMAEKMEDLQNQSNESVGVPAISNFLEKKTLKWVYELCDQANLVCYVYLGNQMEGKVGQYLGRCLGYGIPYSAQFSNPYKFTGVTTKKVTNDVGRDWVADYVLLPQAEPNGIFKPDGMSATWVIMLHPETKEPWPVYIEQYIIVSPFPLPNGDEIETKNDVKNTEEKNKIVSPFNQ